MTRFQKIRNILFGIISILLGVILINVPSEGYMFVITVIAFGLGITGIQNLIHYFTMSRFMVGGKRILYKGVFFLDIGVFTMTLTDVPKTYLLIYLGIIHGFKGLVEILRVLEARRYGSPSWKLKFSHGLVDILMASFCIIFSSKPNTAVLIYSYGLIYSGIVYIIRSLRRSMFIYIQ